MNLNNETSIEIFDIDFENKDAMLKIGTCPTGIYFQFDGDYPTIEQAVLYINKELKYHKKSVDK